MGRRWLCTSSRRRNSAGLTLLEMLIVVAILAVLALIVIPRIVGAGLRSREDTLKGDLRQIRNAIEAFQANTGVLPSALSDLMATNGASIGANIDGNGVTVDRQSYEGPYLITPDHNLPKDPFTKATDWTYSNTTGDVHSSSTLTATDGTAYSQW